MGCCGNTSAEAGSKGSPSGFYELTAKDVDGKDYSFDALRGKVVLIVNLASKCGCATQVAGFEALHREFKDQGLVVLGFPCNQFGQEPGSAKEAMETCNSNYQTTFQMMDKVYVNGDKASDVYRWLKAAKKQWGTRLVKFNFEKFLVGRDGIVHSRVWSFTGPAALRPTIVKLLAQPAA